MDAEKPKTPEEVIKERLAPEPKDNREGWWDLRDLHGSLEGICKAIDERPIPEHWKVAIKTELELRCKDGLNSVWLDAHFLIQGSNATLHFTTTATKMLL